MSRESDYQQLLELKQKMEAVKKARLDVANTQNEINKRRDMIDRVSVSMPIQPKKPSQNHAKSNSFNSEHSGSAKKEKKGKTVAVVILFSLGLLALAIIGFELALNNYVNAHTSFEKWILDEEIWTPGIFTRILTYIGAVLIAGVNCFVCLCDL